MIREFIGGSVTLVVEDGAGRRETVAIEGPGGKIRVGVGRPGDRSTVWDVWANRSKSDVYVAGRTFAGVLKFSLHESGDWRHQWVSEDHASRFTGHRARVIDRWRRPAESVFGWTKGLSIWIAEEDVLDVPNDGQREEGVVWIPKPSSGSAVGVHIVVAAPDRGYVSVRAVPVAGFTLANGNVVLVVVTQRVLDEASRAWLAEWHSRALTTASARGVDVSGAAAGRIGLFAYDSEGNRVVWDLAVDRPGARGHAPDEIASEASVPDELLLPPRDLAADNRSQNGRFRS